MNKEYKKVIKRFIKAKKSNDPKKIRKALIFFIEQLKEIVVNIDSYQDLSLFTKDPDMIFESRHRYFSVSSLEQEVYSSGYLNQLLEVLGVEISISEEIYNAIFELHSELSKGNNDVSDEKKNLINGLDRLGSELRD